MSARGPAPSPAPTSFSRSSTVRFFLLAFGLTWLFQFPAVFAQWGLLPGEVHHYMPLVMLGVFGPLVAATVLSAREGGAGAVRELYAGLKRWRAPLRSYVVPLLLPGLLLTATLGLLRLAGRDGPVTYLPGGERLAVAFVIAFAEEIGWRGYALPRLQKQLGPFAASGVIGIAWTLWHVPMFLGMGIPLAFLLVMLLFFTGGSLLFTWVYNRSEGSVLLCAVAHVGAHLNNSHLALPSDALPLVVHAVVYAGLGLWLMLPLAAGHGSTSAHLRAAGGRR